MNPVVVRAREALTGEVFISGIAAGPVRLLNEDTVLMSPSLKNEAARQVRESYSLLREKYDFIIIEGAGCPSDLPEKEDIPNLLVARLAGVPIVFSCKFSRGGAAAALIGSVNCLPADVRSLVVGFTFSDIQEEDAIGHSVRVVEAHLGIPYLGSVPRVPLWTEGVDSYELLASTVLGRLDWKAMQLADIFVEGGG